MNERVNTVDSFIRMDQEREKKRQKRSADYEAEVLANRARRDEYAAIRQQIDLLFMQPDPQRRGKELEGVLNRLFSCAGISVSESFEVRMHNGKVLEQIDGAIEIDGTLYLVEMKWWTEPIGVPEINDLISRLIHRGGHARGIFISRSPYAETAIETCKLAYPSGASITLCQLSEIIDLLEEDGNLKAMLKAKTDASVLRRKPFAEVVRKGK